MRPQGAPSFEMAPKGASLGSETIENRLSVPKNPHPYRFSPPLHLYPTQPRSVTVGRPDICEAKIY